MKKILFVTSALVAMSSIAVAGDIPAAPSVEAAGFTVTASGKAVVFGFYNGTAVVAPAVQYGIGADYSGEIEAKKTLDDGSEVTLTLGFDEKVFIDAEANYKSAAIGEFKAGRIGGEDEHDIEAPDAPDIPNVGDELEDGDDGLLFADADLSLYTEFKPVFAALAATDYSVTYTSPEFGGFQLGAGVDGAGNIDVAVAGSFALSEATVKVGVRYIASNPTLSTGKATAGASVEVTGFTVGGQFTADLAASTNNAFNVGAMYVTGPFTLGAHYTSKVNAADKGVVTAGVQYEENGLKAVIDGSYNLVSTGATPDAWTAAAGATYKFTAEIMVGATVLASGNSLAGSATKVMGSAGIDYALNSQVTLGAGLGYDGAVFGAAAGLKVKF